MRKDKTNESLMRTDSKKRWQKLYNIIKNQGGDIGEKVARSQKTKETSMPNAYYINNPWDGQRHVDTYESFQLKESRGTNNPSLEDMYTNRNIKPFDQDNDDWIKGTKEDKQRPMFINLPDLKHRKTYDVLRSGRFIEIDGVVGQIVNLKGQVLTVDIVNKLNKHEYVEYDLKKY